MAPCLNSLDKIHFRTCSEQETIYFGLVVKIFKFTYVCSMSIYSTVVVVVSAVFLAFVSQDLFFFFLLIEKTG